jgi:hypothetical protein
VWQNSRLVLLAFCLFAIGNGCDSGGEAEGPATDSSTVVQTSPTPALSTTSGIENAPSGGPAPTKLQGHWLLISKSGHTFKNRFELVIRGRQYGFPVGLVRGQVVAQNVEVDFYNEDLCDLAFPEGVGRYRWKVTGKLLHLDRIEKDPCATRAGVLVDATYRRIG